MVKQTIIELTNDDLATYNNLLTEFLKRAKLNMPLGQAFKNLEANCIEMSDYLPQTTNLDRNQLKKSLVLLNGAFPIIKEYSTTLARALVTNYVMIKQYLMNQGETKESIELALSTETEQLRDVTDYDKLTQEIGKRLLYGKSDEREFTLREKLCGARSETVTELGKSIAHHNDNLKPCDHTRHPAWDYIVDGMKYVEDNKSIVGSPQDALYQELIMNACNNLEARKIEDTQRLKRITKISRESMKDLRGY
jgi:hypothetical protein